MSEIAIQPIGDGEGYFAEGDWSAEEFFVALSAYLEEQLGIVRGLEESTYYGTCLLRREHWKLTSESGMDKEWIRCPSTDVGAFPVTAVLS